MHHLFVYGTLRRGHHNHDFGGFVERAEFLGEARMRGTLYIPTRIPFMTDGDELITGEIYRVDDDLLQTVDVLERGYERTRRPVEEGPVEEAWVYLKESRDRHMRTASDYNDVYPPEG